jgi:hypothetical protein
MQKFSKDAEAALQLKLLRDAETAALQSHQPLDGPSAGTTITDNIASTVNKPKLPSENTIISFDEGIIWYQNQYGPRWDNQRSQLVRLAICLNCEELPSPIKLDITSQTTLMASRNAAKSILPQFILSIVKSLGMLSGCI